MARLLSTTRLGGSAPSESASPSLVFLKFHAYDRFKDEVEYDRKNRRHDLPAFERKRVGARYLAGVAAASHRVHRESYAGWHRRFADACESLGAVTVPATTWWRLVVGWADNPALEVGLELDRLLGFPRVPGSAVKGLLHHAAEMELMESMPPAPSAGDLPAEPPAALREVVGRALRVWLLFGSLAAQRPTEPASAAAAPEPPIERLCAWRDRLRDEGKALGEQWRPLLQDLERMTGDHTGGLVTCFDAVPAAATAKRLEPLLEVDVLTPHRAQNPGGKEGPSPTHFLAVAAGVDFELRFRLRRLPGEAPERDDDHSRLRGRVLAGATRPQLEQQLRSWLLLALEERGLGAKTSAGYGYFHTGSVPKLPPRPRRPAPPPKPEIPPAERYAQQILPEPIDVTKIGNSLQKAIEQGSPEELEAVSRRFARLCEATVETWRRSPSKKKRAVLRRLGLLDGGQR